jgi:urea transport system permease protein
MALARLIPRGETPTSRVPRLEPVDVRAYGARPAPEIARFRRRTIATLLVLLFVVIPALQWAGVVEPYNVNRIGRYLCFAIAALGVDLIWGYTGVLTLCHALFFCLGAYAMGMHLSLPGGGGDVRPEYHNIPQFFFFNNVNVLPAWWRPFDSLPFAVVAAILVPTLVAGLFAFFIFRNRVRGVYFSIITQALAWGAFLAFSRNELLLGGTNGLTNFYKPLNANGAWILGFYLATAAALVLSLIGCRALTRSKLGRVLIGVRDREPRLYFLGYRPELYKTFAFAAAAALAGLGGLLYVPQNGIVTPNVMRVEDSIWMVVWVAVGGRGRLWGAIMGALVVNFSYSMLTSDMPQAWPFIEGALFLAVLAFPDGLSQLWLRLESEVAGGRSIARLLAAFVFVEAVLMIDKLGWLPSILSMVQIAFVPLKYWLLIIAATAVGWSRPAPAAVPLLGLAILIVSEALGLFPTEATPLKYLVVVALAGWYVARETDVVARVVRWLRRRRVEDAAS